MKRLMTMLLCGVLLLGLTACGDEEVPAVSVPDGIPATLLQAMGVQDIRAMDSVAFLFADESSDTAYRSVPLTDRADWAFLEDCAYIRQYKEIHELYVYPPTRQIIEVKVGDTAHTLLVSTEGDLILQRGIVYRSGDTALTPTRLATLLLKYGANGQE